MRARWLRTLALVGLSLTASLAPTTDPLQAHAAPAVAAMDPPVFCVLRGAVDGTSSAVSLVTVEGARTRVRDLGQVDHAQGSARRGAVMPNTEVAIVAVAEGTDRRSTYDSALFRVDDKASRRVLGGLAHAVAPVVSPSGVVLVARGVEGREPTVQESKRLVLRVDALTLDRVDLDTGVATTVWRGTGYQAFPAFIAARDGHEDLVFALIDPSGESLMSVEVTGGAPRTIASVVPFARDFSWDRAHDAIVFADLLTPYSPRWSVDTVPISGGSIRSFFDDLNDHLMPYSVAGEILISTTTGLADTGLGRVDESTRTARSLGAFGPGSDRIVASSADARWLLLTHTSRAARQVAVFDRAASRAVLPSLPGDEEIEPLGFVGAAR
ncbi:MAG: hypothetical protein ACHREM_12795 [Polyangiales bacterium]